MRSLIALLALAASAAAQPLPARLHLVAVEQAVPPTSQQEIGRPLAIRAGASEAFVSDFDDSRVERVTPEGVWIGAVGVAGGTGALRNVSDVTVRGDTVWIADLQSRAIATYLRDGSFVRWLRLSFHPARVAVLPSGLAVLGIGGESPLVVLDRDGGVRRWIHADLESAAGNEFDTADAALAPTPDGFVYLHRNGRAALRFDTTGALVARLPTILHVAVPDGQFIDSRETRSVSVDGDALWVHTRLATPGGHVTSVLDRYRLDTNTYEGSVALPRPLRDAAVMGEHVVGVAEEGLLLFSLQTTPRLPDE